MSGRHRAGSAVANGPEIEGRIVKNPWKFGLLFLAAFIAYLGYAAFALHRAFDALASGDAANIEKFADLDSVRASLKTQIDAEIARRNAGLKRNGANIGDVIGAGVLSAVESGLAGGMIDAFVTPDGLARLIAGKREAKQNAGDRDYLAIWKNAHIEGADTVRFSRDAGFDAVFRFNGLSWRLVDVRVPFQDILKRGR
jgi:hypothetical protein